jgi:uncharacterized protein (TIGR03067 family)
MSELPPSALAEQLRRANRRWRAFAFSSLSALALVLALGASPYVVQARQAPDKEVAAKKEFEKLQGNWRMVSVECAGKPQETPKDALATVAGDQFTTKSGKEVVRAGTLKLDPTQKPKAIDATYTAGPDKGQTFQGIYELEGDTWKICYSAPGKERPKALPDKQGTAYLLLVLKREKPADPWMDKSPHTSHFVKANGVRLHYLDWGGKGDVLLFLPGLSCTAHIFDDLAPKFTNQFRVLALTRRGFGQSDRPEAGYDIKTLVQDLRAFLDALKIDKVILAGHSLGGYELTGFAALYPERVLKLVYLDAAYDHSAAPPEPAPDLQELLAEVAKSTGSLEAFRGFCKKRLTEGLWSDGCEAQMREHLTIRRDGSVEVRDLVGWLRVWHATSKGSLGSKPDYTKVKVPALAFYAIRPLPTGDDEGSRKQREYLERERKWQRGQIENFKKSEPQVRVVEMPDTPHFCFVREQDHALIVKEMKAFLLEKGKGR